MNKSFNFFHFVHQITKQSKVSGLTTIFKRGVESKTAMIDSNHDNGLTKKNLMLYDKIDLD